MAQNWTRLDKEQARHVLNKIGSQPNAMLFTQETTEVSVCALPFYKSYKLYKASNYATMPIFTLLYLSNGMEFVPIDGTANPIYLVNDKDRIQLSERTVIPYLDFFFAHVQGSEGDVYIIKDPRKMPFLDSFSQVQQRSVIGCFKPLTIVSDPVSRSYNVSGTIYYGGGLIASTIKVAHDGKLSFLDQSMLMSGIHFPQSPYRQEWLEG